MSSSDAPVLFQQCDDTRRRLHLTRLDLWVDYMAIGGTADPIDLDAYLHGLLDLPPGQHDVLVHALNEHLYDAYVTARLPYQGTNHEATP